MRSKQPWDVQSARLPSTVIPQNDNALAGEQQRQSPHFMHQQTSDRRSSSLPARQPSVASAPAGSYAMAGMRSAPLLSVAHFLEDSSGISPGSSTTNYSPRTKTCLYKVRWTYLDRSGERANARLHPQACQPTEPTSLVTLQTEVCCSWKKTGRCRYGSKCQFAHGEEELKPVNRHPKYKTEVRNCFVCAPLPHKMPVTYLSPSHVPILRFAPSCTSDLVGSICKLINKLFESELHSCTSGGMTD